MDSPAAIPSFTLAKAVTVPTPSEAQQRQLQRQLAQQLEEADPTTYLTHFSKSKKLATDAASQVELLASADSTNGICLFSRQTLDFGGRITGHDDTVTRITFAKHSPSILWSSSHDGSVRCWDLRTQALAHMFYGTPPLRSLLAERGVGCDAIIGNLQRG
jgi:WD40 repeat protein